MSNLLDNATFGTNFETRDGGKAVYLAHIQYNNTHKIFVQGFNFPITYLPDGTRKAGGKHISKCGNGLDIVKII